MNLETNYKIQKKGITLVIPNPCGNIKETKMKNSGIEWIGEIPEDWEVKKVKHSFVRKNEKAMQENPIVLSLARTGVRERDISNNEGQLAESYYNYNPVDVDDLLINPMDLYSGANCSISKVKGVISPAYINLRAKKNVSPVFYDYYFKVQYWMMAFFAHGNGVSFENRWTLNNETLQNYPIVAPSFETQQRIASYLDKKCSKIEETIQNQQQVIEKLKAYKQSLITEAVTGKVKIENGKACGEYESYKDSGVEWIGKIPSEWEVGKTGMFTYVTKLAGFEFTDIMMDKISEKGDVPIVRAQNVRMFKFNKEIINEYIDLLTSNTLNRCCLDKKCLLITFIGAGIGDICIFDESIRYHLAPNVAKIEIRNFAKTKLCEEFLMYYIGSEPGKREIANISKVAAQPSLSMETIRKIKLCIPPFEEQKLIVDYLYPKCLSIDKTIEQKQNLMEKLTEYKKSLIYECVTGKKEI